MRCAAKIPIHKNPLQNRSREICGNLIVSQRAGRGMLGIIIRGVTATRERAVDGAAESSTPAA